MNINYEIIILLLLCSLLSVIEVDFIKDKKYLFWKLSFYI